MEPELIACVGEEAMDNQPDGGVTGERLTAGPTILIIEDDPRVRECLREGLAGLANEIETASNGHEGLSLFRARRPSLVLTDLLMPGLTGLGVLQGIRGLDPDVPVVLMTGHADYMTFLGRQYGFTAVLRKPMRLDELEAVIKPLLGRAVAPPPSTLSAEDDTLHGAEEPE